MRLMSTMSSAYPSTATLQVGSPAMAAPSPVACISSSRSLMNTLYNTGNNADPSLTPCSTLYVSLVSLPTWIAPNTLCYVASTARNRCPETPACFSLVSIAGRYLLPVGMRLGMLCGCLRTLCTFYLSIFVYYDPTTNSSQHALAVSMQRPTTNTPSLLLVWLLLGLVGPNDRAPLVTI